MNLIKHVVFSVCGLLQAAREDMMFRNVINILCTSDVPHHSEIRTVDLSLLKWKDEEWKSGKMKVEGWKI